MKMTLNELRKFIYESIVESVDFWDQEYLYDPRRDSIEDIIKGAMRWYSFEKSGLQIDSPSDPKFLNKLVNRMKLFGIGDSEIKKVVDGLKHNAPNLRP